MDFFFIESRNSAEKSNYQSHLLQLQELSTAFHLSKQCPILGKARIAFVLTPHQRKKRRASFFLSEVSLPRFPTILTLVLTCSGLLVSHSPSLFMPTWDLVLLELKVSRHTSLVLHNFVPFKNNLLSLYYDSPLPLKTDVTLRSFPHLLFLMRDCVYNL